MPLVAQGSWDTSTDDSGDGAVVWCGGGACEYSMREHHGRGVGDPSRVLGGVVHACCVG